MANMKKGRAGIRPKTHCATVKNAPQGRSVHCITHELKLAAFDFVDDIKGTPFDQKISRREIAMTVVFLAAMTVACMVLEPIFRSM